MNIALPLDKMSLAEKLATMETLWDDLCRHADAVSVPGWHREILAARDAALAAGDDVSVDWETAKQQLRDTCK